MDVIKLHEIETVDTSTIINELMPEFYDYIVASELVGHPYTPPPDTTTAKISIYFNEETVEEPRNVSRDGNIFREIIHPLKTNVY